jgi:outer membrane protein OmpA-like peptidoglycan-associated protein
MRNQFYYLIITILLLLTANKLHSSNDSINTKYGFYGGFNYNQHKADFYKLEGIPNCCPAFESGNGLGFNIGILYEHSLSNDFWIGGRIGLMTLGGDLTRNETTTLILDSGFVDGIFEHKLSGKFMNLGFEPTIIYNPFGGLLLSAGARFGVNISKNYEQVETIINPIGSVTFMDSLGNDTHDRTRNKFTGEIPNAVTFQMAVLGSINYELPLNKTGSLRLVPELSYYFPLSELVTNTDWKVSSIRAGIALKFVPIPKPMPKPIFKKEIFIDTIKIENDLITENKFKSGEDKISSATVETDNEIITTETVKRTDTIFIKKEYKLDGSITAVGVDSLGKEIPNPVFKVEEFISNRLDPLLNYVFFENNSSELPSRYIALKISQTNKFQIDSLFRETTLDIYYHILNIIGKRLTDIPSANITLVGCNSDLGDEKGNINLSQKRAETVRDYLINIWNISSNRIKLENRNLPAKASTPIDEPDKIQENRRVEIYSDNYQILKPIFIEKIDRTANPPIVRFKAVATSKAGLKSWMIKSYQNTDKENQFKHSGDSEIPSKIDWELENFQKIIPKSPEPIIYSLELNDKKGNKKIIDNKTLPIEVITIQKKRIERQGDFEIERFSLILFDFDKATIDGSNQKIIDFISSRVKTESEIEISGYTDRTGDADYNKKLSERRALATTASLKRKDAVASGIGEEKLLYNNDIPEGRFYCRTVNIIVKTKVK